jgi:hypothetical protein
MRVAIGKESDGSYIAYNTTGNKVVLIGTGKTIKDTKEDFYNSIMEVKNDYIRSGYSIPGCLNEPIEFYSE